MPLQLGTPHTNLPSSTGNTSKGRSRKPEHSVSTTSTAAKAAPVAEASPAPPPPPGGTISTAGTTSNPARPNAAESQSKSSGAKFLTSRLHAVSVRGQLAWAFSRLDRHAVVERVKEKCTGRLREIRAVLSELQAVNTAARQPSASKKSRLLKGAKLEEDHWGGVSVSVSGSAEDAGEGEQLSATTSSKPLRRHLEQTEDGSASGPSSPAGVLSSPEKYDIPSESVPTQPASQQRAKINSGFYAAAARTKRKNPPPAVATMEQVVKGTSALVHLANKNPPAGGPTASSSSSATRRVNAGKPPPKIHHNPGSAATRAISVDSQRPRGGGVFGPLTPLNLREVLTPREPLGRSTANFGFQPLKRCAVNDPREQEEPQLTELQGTASKAKINNIGGTTSRTSAGSWKTTGGVVLAQHGASALADSKNGSTPTAGASSVGTLKNPSNTTTPAATSSGTTSAASTRGGVRPKGKAKVTGASSSNVAPITQQFPGEQEDQDPPIAANKIMKTAGGAVQVAGTASSSTSGQMNHSGAKTVAGAAPASWVKPAVSPLGGRGTTSSAFAVGKGGPATTSIFGFLSPPMTGRGPPGGSTAGQTQLNYNYMLRKGSGEYQHQQQGNPPWNFNSNKPRTASVFARSSTGCISSGSSAGHHHQQHPRSCATSSSSHLSSVANTPSSSSSRNTANQKNLVAGAPNKKRPNLEQICLEGSEEVEGRQNSRKRPPGAVGLAAPASSDSATKVPFEDVVPADETHGGPHGNKISSPRTTSDVHHQKHPAGRGLQQVLDQHSDDAANFYGGVEINEEPEKTAIACTTAAKNNSYPGSNAAAAASTTSTTTASTSSRPGQKSRFIFAGKNHTSASSSQANATAVQQHPTSRGRGTANKQDAQQGRRQKTHPSFLLHRGTTTVPAAKGQVGGVVGGAAEVDLQETRTGKTPAVSHQPQFSIDQEEESGTAGPVRSTALKSCSKKAAAPAATTPLQEEVEKATLTQENKLSVVPSTELSGAGHLAAARIRANTFLSPRGFVGTTTAAQQHGALSACVPPPRTVVGGGINSAGVTQTSSTIPGTTMTTAKNQRNSSVSNTSSAASAAAQTPNSNLRISAPLIPNFSKAFATPMVGARELLVAQSTGSSRDDQDGGSTNYINGAAGPRGVGAGSKRFFGMSVSPPPLYRLQVLGGSAAAGAAPTPETSPPGGSTGMWKMAFQQ
ncbi:unnamed protein product [Amoebophrya sp. A120]|nr:unnamed protein product [Amoebophrya sp. A120]|eukprot:GSA120T00000219001.1